LKKKQRKNEEMKTCGLERKNGEKKKRKKDRKETQERRS
jgi:hypothetical protein